MSLSAHEPHRQHGDRLEHRGTCPHRHALSAHEPRRQHGDRLKHKGTCPRRHVPLRSRAAAHFTGAAALEDWLAYASRRRRRSPSSPSPAMPSSPAAPDSWSASQAQPPSSFCPPDDPAELPPSVSLPLLPPVPPSVSDVVGDGKR